MIGNYRIVLREIGMGIVAAAIGLSPGVASAKKMPGSTPLLLLASPPAPEKSELGRGDVIISTRMVYALLAVAQEDIVGRDGSIGTAPKILLRKGAQMFGVQSDTGQITYCAIDHKEVGAGEGIFVINRDKHTCFVDANRDGAFEASYDLRTKFSTGVPLYYDVEVAANPLVKPVAYRAIDPRDCALDMVFETYVGSLSRDGRKVQVRSRLRAGEDISEMAGVQKVVLDQTREIGVLDARFTLTYGSPSKLSAKVIHGITAQEFSTMRPEIEYLIISI